MATADDLTTTPPPLPGEPHGSPRRRGPRPRGAVAAVLALTVSAVATLAGAGPVHSGSSAGSQAPVCGEPFLPVHVSRTLYSARFGTPQVWPEHAVAAPSYDIYGMTPPERVDTDGDGVADGVRLGDGPDGPVATAAVTSDRATITVVDGGSRRTFTTPPSVRDIPTGASVTSVRADDGRIYLALISATFVVASPSEFRALWDLEDPCRALPRLDPEPTVCPTPQLPSFVAAPRPDGGPTQIWPPTPTPVDRPAGWGGDLPVLALLDRDLDGIPDYHAVPPMRAGSGRTTVAVERTATGFTLAVEGGGRLRTLTTPDDVPLPSAATVRFFSRWIDDRPHLVLALVADPRTDDRATHEVVWDLEAPCGAAGSPGAPAAPAAPAGPVAARASYTG